MRRSFPPLRWSPPEPTPEQHCSLFDRSSSGSFDSSSLSSCWIFSDAPSVRGCVDSQSGLQGSKNSPWSDATLTKERHMRRSLPPLRAISSPSAELGVDGTGRSQLRSAFLPHLNQEPAVSRSSLGYFVGSTDAQKGARPICRHPGDVIAGPSAAPQPQFSEEEI
jgi:hypothetical protein